MGSSVNAKYGIDPGAVLCTHVSGHYGPFHTRLIPATMSEAPCVLDGLHHHAHQTDLRIIEHYTDTAGATDHVFGLCHLSGYRFAPRIKDLKDHQLYTVEKSSNWPLLEPLIGDTVDTTAIIDRYQVDASVSVARQHREVGDQWQYRTEIFRVSRDRRDRSPAYSAATTTGCRPMRSTSSDASRHATPLVRNAMK